MSIEKAAICKPSTNTKHGSSEPVRNTYRPGNRFTKPRRCICTTADSGSHSPRCGSDTSRGQQWLHWHI